MVDIKSIPLVICQLAELIFKRCAVDISVFGSRNQLIELVSKLLSNVVVP